jgi:hypothetical protein
MIAVIAGFHQTLKFYSRSAIRAIVILLIFLSKAGAT